MAARRRQGVSETCSHRHSRRAAEQFCPPLSVQPSAMLPAVQQQRAGTTHHPPVKRSGRKVSGSFHRCGDLRVGRQTHVVVQQFQQVVSWEEAQARRQDAPTGAATGLVVATASRARGGECGGSASKGLHECQGCHLASSSAHDDVCHKESVRQQRNKQPHLHHCKAHRCRFHMEMNRSAPLPMG